MIQHCTYDAYDNTVTVGVTKCDGGTVSCYLFPKGQRTLIKQDTACIPRHIKQLSSSHSNSTQSRNLHG